MAIIDLFRNLAGGAGRIAGRVADGAQAAAGQMANMAAPAPQMSGGGGGFLAGLRGPIDPQAIDPNTGLPMGLVHMQKMASLQKLGATLVAAGQNVSGDKRAEILAGMGDAMDPTKGLYSMVQAQYMNEDIIDGRRQRSRRENALNALKGETSLLDTLGDRERAVFNAYLEAGDPEGALEFVSQTNSQILTLPNGVQTTKGAYQADTNNWNKVYQPVIQGATGTVDVVREVLGVLDEGFISGQLANAQLTAAKLSRYAGQEIRPDALATEQGRSLALQLVINRMKDLGGNDSYQEFQKLAESVMGDSLEESTIRNNLTSLARRSIKEATIAEQQKAFVGTPDYGLTFDWQPDMIRNSSWRQFYDEIEAGRWNSPGGRGRNGADNGAGQSGTNSGGGAPAVSDYRRLWN